MKIYNKIISCVLIVSIVLSLLITAPFSAFASGINPQSTIQLTGTCHYDEAFDILEKVNELRIAKGLHPLNMEPQLMEDAMQRASELMLTYSHDRPDGSSCFDINDDAFAENIAIGYGSTAAVMNGWVNSEIHYANIMSEDFKSIGIGAVVHNGVPCWVQLFGIKSYDEKIDIPENTTKNFDIFIGDENYELTLDIPSSLFVGDSAQPQVIGYTKGNSCYYTLNSDDFTYSSSNTDVATTDNDGIDTVGVGEATITATSNYTTVSAQIEVSEFCAGKSRQCGENVFWDFKNGTLTLTGTGDMYNYEASYDEDYNVTTDIPYVDGSQYIKKVVVSEGITGISQYAFSGFSYLETAELPSTLKTMGMGAFANSYRLKSVSMHEGITEIPPSCFDTCFSLKTMTIPQSVEVIGYNAFLYCTGLESIILPDNLTYIDSCVFHSCISLKEITIPKNVSIIESGTFNQCDSLKKVTILNPNIRFGVYNMFSTLADKLTIYGYNDSTAETHCKYNSINFVSLGDSPDLVIQLIGDANLDGVVDIRDVTTLQRFVAQITDLEYDAMPLSDTVRDGYINISDATQIQRFLAHLIDEF